MKRTLLEIAAGLAVVVLMASFHQQVERLRSRSDDVATLREMVEVSLAEAGSREEIEQMRQQLEGLLEDRVNDLESELAVATKTAREADALRLELDQARREAALIKSEIRNDVRRTQQLVENYHAQLRAQDESVLESTSRTKEELQVLQSRVVPNPDVLTKELLLPTVQLNGDDTVGSGTLVRSSRDARTGKVENWVLTSHHVIRNILADSARARDEGIPVTIYADDGKRYEVLGKMVSHEESIDAALMKLETNQTFERVARIMPRSHLDSIETWDEIWAIGCPLGNDPIPTRGAIASKSNMLNGTNYWMINAPTYYGNSGGGIYLAEERALVGVFSKIYTHGRGQPVVVPHMGLCTPITAIYDWLDREKLGHVLPQVSEEMLRDPRMHLAAPGK